MFEAGLRLGDTLTNDELRTLFKCGNMGGMRRSRQTGTLVIISDDTKSLYKDEWKKAKRGKSDTTKDEFMQWTNGMWTFSGESKKKIGHPAPFPVELPKRCIKLFSYVGDIVLDPFMGSGTTIVASKTLDRKSMGIEISREYCELAFNRILKY